MGVKFHVSEFFVQGHRTREAIDGICFFFFCN